MSEKFQGDKKLGKKLKWLHSIKTKQLIMLFTILFLIMLCSYYFFHAVTQVAVNAIYRQMESQAEYYVGSVEYQIAGIMQQQADFFSDRQLAFLADRELIQNDYDRRETLLSLQDRLFSLKSSNKLIKKVVLYIPGSNYILMPSRIGEFGQEDTEKLEELKQQLGKLVPEGKNLSYTLAEALYSREKEPNFYLQVVLDEEQLTDNLNTFAAKGGGSCWVNPLMEWFLEDTAAEGMGQEIVAQLLRQGDGFDKMMEVQADGRDYLVSVAQSQYLGMLVQYYPKESVLAQPNRYSRLFAVFMIGALCLTVLFSRYTEKMVNRPLQKLYEAFRVLQQGNMDIQISHSASDEFEYIYEGFNNMTRQLHRLIDEVYVQKNLAQKSELKQLQAQINPHFLYNSFFLLSRRVKRGDMENAGVLADYLGTYFQFLTRNASDTVPLLKEMEHAECYARIQGTRFASRIDVILEELPEAAARLTVPRLIVQPVLENAFEHGLEDKEEDGILKVFYSMDAEYIRIQIENNGDTTQEEIDKMRGRLKDDYDGEVTGLVNIHRRLKSFFKGKGGMEICRGELGGVLVTLKLPLSGQQED